jgi:hypothetical protein
MGASRPEGVMIARHWRGWTQIENGDAYEILLKTKVLPGLSGIGGYRGGYILRRDGPREIEFVVINFFDSLEAVKQFAGPDYAVPVFEPEAKKLLCRVEPLAIHYDVRAGKVAG